MRRPPDRGRALDLYRKHAENYDRTGRMTAELRRRAISLLSIQPGDTVLDVGSGTGLSLPVLRDAVGPGGRVIGIELSPQMAERARGRIASNGWDNVTIVNAAAEEADVPEPVDGVLFFLTHDLMRSASALENVMSSLRPGGRAVSFGAKLPPLWAFPLIPIVWLVGRPYVTTYEGIRHPWDRLTSWVPDLKVRSALLGCAYFAWGSTSPADGEPGAGA